MGKSTPARSRAIRFLAEMLAGATPGARLPALRPMAVRAGVSHVTMHLALRDLVSRGVVTCEGRNGYRLAAPDGLLEVERAASQAGRTQRWERTAARMRAEILNAASAEPVQAFSVKELQHRYGVSFRTMRKVLDTLAAEGYMVSTPSGYRPAGPAAGRPGGAVGLLILAREPADIRMLPPRTVEFYTRLEDACVRAGLRLLPLWYVHSGRGPVPANRDPHALERLAGSPQTVGFVAWPSAMAELAWQEVAGTLSAAGKPLAIVDETANPALPGVAHRHRLVRLFSFSVSSLCGSLVGRYLLRLGHRRVAFVTATPEGAWSRNRLDGLRAAYEDAGVRGGVTAVLLAPPQSAEQALPATGRLLSAELPQPERTLAGRVIETMRTELQLLYSREAQARRLAQAVAPLLTDQTVTAWVGANDDLAVLCLDLLARRRVRVPEDLSVVGFDDSRDACFAGLTSYSFNVAGVVRAALQHILGGPLPWTRSQRVVVVQGYVSIRGTSGPARRHGGNGVPG